MIRRALAAVAAVAAVALVTAAPAAAHPIGNSTINRATAVTIGPDRVAVVHVVDMAEIPAYAAILDIDYDRDGATDAGERTVWALSACEAARKSLRATIDGLPVPLASDADPELTFPPGVGGLETLRLVCRFGAPLTVEGGAHSLTVIDGGDDGRRGWREVTIVAGARIALISADVPSVSPSALLTAYPEDLLQAPIETTGGTATYRSDQSGAEAPAAANGDTSAAEPGTNGGTDVLVDLLDGGAAPWSWLLAVAVAAGLGAAHAVSPGHGKALIAAYVIGSRGSLRRAAGLGLTVAVSHTVGVFVLGAIVLSATELLVPDRVVAWLSVASGVVVVGLGASIARRTWRARRASEGHAHLHAHSHDQSHPHPHPHGDHGQGSGAGTPATREFLTLGLVGGMVPSTSALLVLLVAVATGRLVEGLFLILAFGAGMAIVLGGLAAVTALARQGLADAAARPRASGLRRHAGVAPLASAVVIIVVGVATTVGALGNL